MDPKFKKGVVVKNNKSSNKQTGSDNIPTLGKALEELAKCDPCGCNSQKCYITNCNATHGENVVLYVTGDAGGPYTLVIEDYDTAMDNIQVLYDARCS
jgi:hypothetical protein